MDILHTCMLYNVLLHNCCLPGVAPAIIVLLHTISLAISVTVTVGDDNEPNNVDFVLIYIHCEFAQTFQ